MSHLLRHAPQPPILRRSDCASDDDYLARMLARYRRQGELFDRAAAPLLHKRITTFTHGKIVGLSSEQHH